MHHSLWNFCDSSALGECHQPTHRRKEKNAQLQIPREFPSVRPRHDSAPISTTDTPLLFLFPSVRVPAPLPLSPHTHTITLARERNSLLLREDGPSNNRPPFPVQPNQTHTTLVSLSRYTLLSIALKKSLLPSSRLVTYLSVVSSSAVRPLRNRAQQYGGFFSPPSKRRRILVRRVLDQLSTRIMLSLHQLPKEETASR